jgi:acyl-CoA thioester hydrolase
MQVVHHSNYIRWFEEARVDFMEQMGKGYDKVEEDGIISPVVSINCNYKTMTRFGESVYIITKIEDFTGVKFTISYKVVDAVTKEVRATGESKHCFINKEGKIVSLKRVDKEYYDLFSSFVGVESVIK